MPQAEFSFGRSESGQISGVTIITVMRLAIGLLIAALIVIALTNPSGAQINKSVSTENTPSSAEQQNNNAALFVRCLQDWDGKCTSGKPCVAWLSPRHSGNARWNWPPIKDLFYWSFRQRATPECRARRIAVLVSSSSERTHHDRAPLDTAFHCTSR